MSTAGAGERHGSRDRDGGARGLARLTNLVRYAAIHRRFRAATMIPRSAYVANLYLADRCLAQPALAQGCVIECGTWRGGMAAGLATIGGPGRDYHFFDSYAGLPPATAEDGAYAVSAQAARDGRLYFDNNTASLEEFTATLGPVGLPPQRLHIHKGFFAESLNGVAVPAIALLRLDADWYESTLLCLEAFWDRLMPGALVLIDDYYAWEGCTKAVHVFLARRGAAEPIRQSRFGKVAYLRKN
jgi:hypothetical protein